jgi:hypothetical protein
MTNPVSLPLWILLIVMIGVPVHAALNHGLARWRGKFELSLIVTMVLVTIVSLIALPEIEGAHFGLREVERKLLFALASGVLFGAPIGLIFRAMARPGH